ncbi:uncharacterized protein DUF2752 [Dokdonia sp. Hel_I_63]|jgi:hypothetical protein|uniref:DUF2752 domain-containing protein n=1 Tax=unclassified Dokdonia TaxID=2615033 RepID=UPI00020A6866|nr:MULTISPECIES: DUF2752 domain-containing protein [unclassified Dokdonia]AEE20105.1 hypothetical protein Krodi_2123 [Dokdonia sp. 4H-3-7-5]AWH72813.1 DUF2752 domain-containing protein [Dokdonia sp. Dokd-P16]TVZ23641.1 uncharacterized protein DUF2752 [Dokdonia sp. Hel_I_63]
MDEYMLPCLNKKYLGFECMGCGIQRSISLLFKGEFIEAFYMYPAIYPLIALLGFLMLNQFTNLKFANKGVIFLAILTVATIIISYTIKMTN